jgi:hypothetical protein
VEAMKAISFSWRDEEHSSLACDLALLPSSAKAERFAYSLEHPLHQHKPSQDYIELWHPPVVQPSASTQYLLQGSGKVLPIV